MRQEDNDITTFRRLQRLIGSPPADIALSFAPGAPVPESSLSLAKIDPKFSLAVAFYSRLNMRSRPDCEISRAMEWCRHGIELRDRGDFEIIGVSVQASEKLTEICLYWDLYCIWLSDPRLSLADALGLPTRKIAGQRVYQPLTMLIRDGRISRVRYPLNDRKQDAAAVLASIKRGNA